MEAKGYVNYVGSKQFGNRTAWSFSLKNQEGWYRTGSTDPKISKNDLISFQYTTGRYGNEVDVASIRKVDLSASDGGGDAAPKSRGFGGANAAKDEYWAAKEARDIKNEGHRLENEKRIQYQSARNAAIAVVDILTREKALIIPEKKGAGAEVILGKIEDLTNQFYEATTSLGKEQNVEPGFDDDANIPFNSAKEAF